MAEKAAVKNAADGDQVKQAEQKEKTRRQRELNDLAFICDDPRGRRFLWRLLSECAVFKAVFNPNNSIMSHNEGRRQVGLDVLADIMAVDETLFHTMAHENRAEEAKAS